MCYPVSEQVEKPMDMFKVALADPLPTAVDPLFIESLSCSQETRNPGWNPSGKLKTCLTLPSFGPRVDVARTPTIHLSEAGHELPPVEHLIGNLQKCRDSQHLPSAMHELVVVSNFGLEGVMALGNYLVVTFMECGSIGNAQQVFDRMPLQNEFICTSLMHRYIELQQWHQALSLFDKVRADFESFSPPLLVVLLKACAHLKWVKRGQELHAEESVVLALANAVIDMYGRCGSMIDSQKVFDETSVKDIYTWTALVSGFSRKGEYKLVFSFFERMERQAIKPDGVIFLSLLNSRHLKDITLPKPVFDRVPKHSVSNSNRHPTSMWRVSCIASGYNCPKEMSMVDSGAKTRTTEKRSPPNLYRKTPLFISEDMNRENGASFICPHPVHEYLI
ncbi:hypothetical protein GOP47_0015348 [Adiantum capillus-veneris]|uniref:Pentatricopeptide repeat-containing protein n=1 Tax=Adiantum capillus-veneris TaxID=13818 RepID=A0A9D4UJV0_ADICA|nr:hypothetical protein GOP47_0015348 [Adiantum capillus-veneris]